MEHRQRLHDLIDRLDSDHVSTIERLLEALTESPAQRAMRLAPPDDEPVTAADEEAIRAAESDSRPPVPFEEIAKEFGLKSGISKLRSSFP
jgi:hypothetical protein